MGGVRLMFGWLLFVAGVAAVGWGLWLAWPPLAWIVVGVLVAVVGVAELVPPRSRGGGRG